MKVLLDVFSKDWHGLIYFVQLLIQRKKWDELLLVYTQMADLSEGPMSAYCHFLRGRCFEVELGRLPEAIEAYKDALYAWEDCHEALMAMIRLHRKMGNTKGLWALYQSKAEKQPLGNIGRCCWECCR